MYSPCLGVTLYVGGSCRLSLKLARQCFRAFLLKSGLGEQVSLGSSGRSQNAKESRWKAVGKLLA